MITYEVYFTVKGEPYGFFYHFDKIPSERDLNVSIYNAVQEHFTDLGLNEPYSDLEFSLYP